MSEPSQLARETAFKREIVFRPAWDKRSNDPKKNYGIHGVEMLWLLKGPNGVIQWLVYTNWHLDHVERELDGKSSGRFPHLSCHPQPADLGYHSPVKMYDGQEVMTQSCEHLGGKPCYYDGSGLNAVPIFTLLKEQGSEAVWRELEAYYFSTFGQLSHPTDNKQDERSGR